jgi:hypothetical protein
MHKEKYGVPVMQAIVPADIKEGRSPDRPAVDCPDLSGLATLADRIAASQSWA